jgi:hypothetical protein
MTIRFADDDGDRSDAKPVGFVAVIDFILVGDIS